MSSKGTNKITKAEVKGSTQGTSNIERSQSKAVIPAKDSVPSTKHKYIIKYKCLKDGIVVKEAAVNVPDTHVPSDADLSSLVDEALAGLLDYLNFGPEEGDLDEVEAGLEVGSGSSSDDTLEEKENRDSD